MKLSPKYELVLVGALLSAHFALAYSASFFHSLTFDEHAHLPAGIAYVHRSDYRLNLEHPPLPKIIAALSTLFMKLHWDDNDPVWQLAGRWIALKDQGKFNSEISEIPDSLFAEWGVGPQFLYQWNRERLADILARSRFLMTLLSVLTGLIVFAWGKQIFGSEGALFALAFYCFSPDLLGHGPLITTDVCYTLFNTWTLCLAFRFLTDVGSLKDHAATLIQLSIALAGLFLSKYSAPIILIFFTLIVPLAGLIHDDSAWQFIRHKTLGFLLTIFGAALLLYSFYMVWFGRFFYPEGLRIVATSALVNPNPRYYLMGEWRTSAPFYFVWAFLLKMTLPAVLLYALFFLVGVRGFYSAARNRTAPSSEFQFQQYSILFGILFLLLISLKFPKIGVRYMFPLWPLVFLGIGNLFSVLRHRRAWFGIMMGLLGWHVFSAVTTYPNYISYFNELAWTKGKAFFLGDSNLDWGQDLPALRRYCEARGIKQIKGSFVGFADPSFYGIQSEEMTMDDLDQSPKGTVTVISVYYLQGMDGETKERLKKWELKAVINDTLYVYEKY